jgi:Icc-related predicted phosphoesterase
MPAAHMEADCLALRILLVADIHDDVASVRRLVGWLRSSSLHVAIDRVIVAGDLSTMPMNPLLDVSEFETRTQEVLLALADIAPTYFVPGNHDIPPLFAHNSSALPALAAARHRVHNLHGRFVSIAPGLSAMGWGGSSVATAGNESVWPGWPYAEDVIAANYQRLLQSIEAPSEASGISPPLGDSLLLVPHCGPLGSGTTADTAADSSNLSAPGVRVGPPIETGSSALRQFVEARAVQQRAVALVHGHTHAGSGSAHIGRLPIFNPGSLRYGGTFGLLELQRGGAMQHHSRWRVTSAHQLQLGATSSLSRTSFSRTSRRAIRTSACGQGLQVSHPKHQNSRSRTLPKGTNAMTTAGLVLGGLGGIVGLTMCIALWFVRSPSRSRIEI